MSITTFSGSAISTTYQRVVQTDGILLADGTGSILDNLNLPNLSITNNLYVSGTLYAENTVTVTQSYYSGSNIFGNELTDTHQFTGSILATGSEQIIGYFNVTGSSTLSGSNTLLGTTDIKHVLIVTGSIYASASVNIIGDSVMTGSLFVTSTNDDVFVVKNQSNTSLLTVTQSGVITLSTQSTELTDPAPNGGIYFTSTNFYLGLN